MLVNVWDFKPPMREREMDLECVTESHAKCTRLNRSEVEVKCGDLNFIGLSVSVRSP